jgi:putative transcriptional regulator
VDFSYKKMWRKAFEEGLNKTQLRDSIGISNSCLAKLSKNENVSMETLAKLCERFNCDIGDIMEYVGGEKVGKKD